MSSVTLEYWNFPGLVLDAAGVLKGQALAFSTTISQTFPANVTNSPDDSNLTFRTKYVGVALFDAAQGENVTIRPWTAGTMSARCLTATAQAAGTTWAWSATDKAFIPDATDVATAVSISPIPGDAVAQTCELLALHGGPK